MVHLLLQNGYFRHGYNGEDKKSLAHNEGAQRQVFGRAQRLGLTETVEVFEINVVGTFQNRVIQNSID